MYMELLFWKVYYESVLTSWYYNRKVVFDASKRSETLFLARKRFLVKNRKSRINQGAAHFKKVFKK